MDEKEFYFKYLNKVLLNVQGKRFKYTKIDEASAEITYLNRPSSLSFEINKCGLMSEFIKQKYKIKEQAKLRKGSKNYERIIKINNRKIKIDSFVGGRIDVVFLAFYENEEETRYLFPFSSDGSFYPTYKYVTKYMDGIVTEEYMIKSNQVIYEKYEKKDKNKTCYLRINYVPKGKYKLLDYEKGIFDCSSSLIVYNKIEQKTWLDE